MKEQRKRYIPCHSIIVQFLMGHRDSSGQSKAQQEAVGPISLFEDVNLIVYRHQRDYETRCRDCWFDR